MQNKPDSEKIRIQIQKDIEQDSHQHAAIIIRDKKIKYFNELVELNKEKEKIEPKELRKIGIQYFFEYWNILRQIFEGGTIEFASIGGQTLDEETSHIGFQWQVPLELGLDLSRDFWENSISTSKKSLVGSDQFKRLIEEMNNLIGDIYIPEVSAEVILSSLGKHLITDTDINPLKSVCDIVHSFLEYSLKPIVVQVAERANYIMKRSSIIAKRYMEKKRKNLILPKPKISYVSSDIKSNLNEDDSYFFHSFVKENFIEFSDRMHQMFLQHCLDEFYGSSTLLWSYTKSHGKGKIDDIIHSSNEIFQIEKERITNKMILLLCNYFIFSVTDNLYGWEQIPHKVHLLNDSELIDLFQIEIKSNSIDQDEQRVKSQMKNIEEKEMQLFGEFIYEMKSTSTSTQIL